MQRGYENDATYLKDIMNSSYKEVNGDIQYI